MWLLSYEARYKCWLPSYGVKDHISGHSLFNHLRAKKVFFYDEGEVMKWRKEVVSAEFTKLVPSESYSQ